MEFRQIHYFIALYQEGSVTQAARRMNIVQPAISQQLSKLEGELGQNLFHRTSKGMVPTKAGEEAYRLLRPIVQDLDHARQELSVRKGATKGHLSVGAVSSVALNLLSETLIDFNSSYPDVSIRMTGGYSPDLQEMLRNAQLDVAIINAPARSMNFKQKEILTEDFALICKTDHPIHPHDGITLEEVSRLGLIVPSFRHGLRTLIESAASARHLKLRPRLEFDEIGTIDDFVQKSEFVTILPPLAVRRSLQSGALEQHVLTPKISRTIVCATSPTRPMNQVTQLFIETLKAHSTGAVRRLRDSLK